MATYTADQMYGTGSQGETISGSTLFTFINPSGSSYFTLETIQDRTGSFSGKQKTTSGSWIPSTDYMGPVQSDYFASVVVAPGTSSVTLTPASPITGSNYKIKGTGAFSMTTFTPTATLFAAGEKGVWFDASDLSTMFTDVAGTQPVTGSGQLVALWRDKSGNGAHATQATLASRPTYRVAANGYSYLDFDGANDSMVTSNIAFSSPQMMASIGLLVDPTAVSTGFAIELSATSTTNVGTFAITAPATAADHGYTLNGSAVINARVNNVVPGDDVLTGLFDISQATKELELIPRLSGQVMTNITWSGAASAGTGNFGTYPLYIGGRGGASSFFKGRIYQIIVREGLSTATQIYQTETFLDSKHD